jgi:hypothetical protein
MDMAECPRSGLSNLGGRRRTPAAQMHLRHLDLSQQLGVTIQHFEQFHQGQRRLGLAGLVAGENIGALCR